MQCAFAWCIHCHDGRQSVDDVRIDAPRAAVAAN